MHKDLIEGLRKSRKLVGELQPVIKNQRGEILVGKHRHGAFPNWSSMTIEQKDELQKLLIILHGSFQRRLSKKEVRQMHLDIAKLLEERGTPRKEIAVAVSQEGGLELFRSVDER